MNWTGVSAFLHMGGYGWYVWGSVLVVLGGVLGELGLLHVQRRQALRLLRLKRVAGVRT